MDAASDEFLPEILELSLPFDYAHYGLQVLIHSWGKLALQIS